MLRIPFEELYAAIHRAMLALGLTGKRAELCALLFAETTRDGVYSHGLNRFGRFKAMAENGSMDIHGTAECTARFGALERWDGHRGPGNLSAHASMNRAIELSHKHGLGAVALAHTTHWMRGGTYGWLAAEAGVFGICWTNTMPNLPAWGGTNPALGNNPLIMAVPRPGGHVVLDMAMSQFSYGALAGYIKRGETLPVAGGYDSDGRLTFDAAAIDASQRALPIGYWKGSGLAIMLDLFAAMLAGGQATHQISSDPMREAGVSQFFLAIDPASFASAEEMTQIAETILTSVRESTPAELDKPVRYPGEQTLSLRAENMRLGVPVDPEIWAGLNR